MWNRTKHLYQSNLNKGHIGFTNGSGATNGQLIAQELLTDAKEEGKVLILQALDGSKAFDGVSHIINHVKLFHHGITDNNLIMVQEQYREQSKIIRWEGRDSTPIYVEQGLAQGAHNSPPQYLTHNNSNLEALDQHSNGNRLGDLKITNVTCADDELLASSSHLDAQTQLNLISVENSRDRNIVNGSKTEAKILNSQNLELLYNNEKVPINTSTKHLGLELSENSIDAEKIIQKSRKTIYALMGAGVHGMNGINPVVSRKIWDRYNIPRCTHGLDIQICSTEELQKIQLHEHQYLKMTQTLPKFSPNILTHILVGGKPVTTILHQKMLSLLMNIRRKEDLEFEIGKRQLLMKPSTSNSWFHRVNKVANIYGLPNCYTVFFEYPWAKQNWKEVVKKSINDHLETLWRGEICRLDTLKMINPLTIKVGKSHPAWETAMFSRQATKEAISKVRMLTDTMMNGEKESKMFNRSPQCQCSHPVENRFHLILDCPVYQDNREHCISRMITLINGNHLEITETQIRDRTALCYLILDPSWFRSDIGSPGFSVPNILYTRSQPPRTLWKKILFSNLQKKNRNIIK